MSRIAFPHLSFPTCKMEINSVLSTMSLGGLNKNTCICFNLFPELSCLPLEEPSTGNSALEGRGREQKGDQVVRPSAPASRLHLELCYLDQSTFYI